MAAQEIHATEPQPVSDALARDLSAFHRLPQCALGHVEHRGCAFDVAMSRSLLKLEWRPLGDHYAACRRNATVASAFS